jgi:uncharacterized membrane protein
LTEFATLVPGDKAPACRSRFLMALFLGMNTSFASLQQFMSVVLTTTEGLFFLAIGNLVGVALSLILFSLTAVSCPLLLDRDESTLSPP